MALGNSSTPFFVDVAGFELLHAAAHAHAVQQPVVDIIALQLPERIAVHGHRAVSYTHLDVYKRQICSLGNRTRRPIRCPLMCPSFSCRQMVAMYIENGSSIVSGVLTAVPILTAVLTFALVLLVVRKVVGLSLIHI